ncbi:MAG: hypothetical protein WC137_02835 [Alphaproteobacteria bacterium]
MKISKLVSGGFYKGQRTYIISGIGILSAIAAYLIGDENVFNTMNSIFTFAGIFFLRKSNERKKNANSRKISK